MSLFAELTLPAKDFALAATLDTVPSTTIDIERVIATDRTLAPYFWVATDNFDAFEEAASADPSIARMRQLDEFEDTGLYRGDWNEDVAPVQFAYSELDAGLLEANGSRDGWELRIQFDERDQLEAFCEFCNGQNIDFRLSRLHEIERAAPGEQYGLTQKQEKALVTAWEMGFFDTPRTATLGAVSEELGISSQSLSDRIRRGTRNWISDALVVDQDRVEAD